MFEYIVIQAGGLGSRLKQYTVNKPKAIVPVNGLPIAYHLFRKYPAKKYIIIADYKADVLRRYIEAFPEVDCVVVEAQGKGTCAGIQSAIDIIPADEPFLLIWSDLILGTETLDDVESDDDWLGISKEFSCRWSYVDGKFVEEPSAEHGVAGLFIFHDKSRIEDVPLEGEFVRYLSHKKITFKEVGLYGANEVGTLIAYDSTTKSTGKFNCRPFNKMIEKAGHLLKIPVDKQGETIAKDECAWYEHVRSLGFKNIPEIYSYEPLEMERIDGCNLYDLDMPNEEKAEVIDELVRMLTDLHTMERRPRDVHDLQRVYYTKTFDRLSKVRDLIPFADKERIVVNGMECHNPYFVKDRVRRLIEGLLYDCDFSLIHGDCTFSNIMRTKTGRIVLLDPRGYFGHTKFYGDEAYDWAKLYYSIAGDYDQFNQRRFSLNIDRESVDLHIPSNGWSELTDYYLGKISCHVSSERIKLLHALIWLSLTTYAWDDYDSICGAFYKGTYLLEELL